MALPTNKETMELAAKLQIQKMKEDKMKDLLLKRDSFIHVDPAPPKGSKTCLIKGYDQDGKQHITEVIYDY